MRRIVAALSLLAFAGLAFAQDATLTAPVARTSESKYTARDFCVSQSQATIEVSVQDAGSAEIRVVSYAVPDPAHPSATVVGFLTAIGTVRASETGTVLRKANFRILGFLFDNGYLPAATLNP